MNWMNGLNQIANIIQLDFHKIASDLDKRERENFSKLKFDVLASRGTDNERENLSEDRKIQKLMLTQIRAIVDNRAFASVVLKQTERQNYGENIKNCLRLENDN